MALPAPQTLPPLVDAQPPALPSLSLMRRVLGTMGMATPKPSPNSLPSLNPMRRGLGTMGKALHCPLTCSNPLVDAQLPC